MTENTTWPGWKQVRKLGSGSYGTVYEICREDDSTFHDALKVITIPQDDSEINSVRTEGLDDASITSYFREQTQSIISEIRMMDQVKGYTNIVSYQEHMVVPHKDGIGYDILIRMELLTPLIQYSVDHSLTVGDVRKMAMDLLGALRVCETYHIVHRDIKPENIFINKTGDYKLGDFGIARRMEESIGTMSAKGTYNYMAPEIYRGLKGSRNVDIYSLGMVLYKYLNHGRLPFLPPAGELIRPHDREEALAKRMSGEKIPAPAEGDASLKKAVMKAVEYDPSERWQSAEEFIRALTGGYMAGNTDLYALDYNTKDSDKLNLDMADDSVRTTDSVPDNDSDFIDPSACEKTIYTTPRDGSDAIHQYSSHALDEPQSLEKQKLYENLFPDEHPETKQTEDVVVNEKPAPKKKYRWKKKHIVICASTVAAICCVVCVLMITKPWVTKELPPFTTVSDASDITFSTAYLSAEIPQQSVDEYGICIGREKDGLVDRIKIGSGKVKNMSYDAKNLKSADRYFYRFYYTVGKQTENSEVRSFSTSSNLYDLDFDLGVKDLQTVEKEGVQSEKELFAKQQTIGIDMNVSTSVRKKDGYEVTYNVTWDYKNNPKIQTKKASMEAANKVVTPWPACAVFDYSTGKNLWSQAVAEPTWGETRYYGDQSYTTTDGKYLITVKYGKSDSIIFTVKVPEKNAHIAVALGVISDNESREFHHGFGYESDFQKYKDSTLYSKGNMSYMRLDSDTLKGE